MQFTATTQYQIYFSGEETIDLNSFSTNINKCYIPAKFVKRMKNLSSDERESLLTINSDVTVSVELCYIITNNLSDTFSVSNRPNANNNEQNGWKSLHSTILQDQVSDCKSTTYLHIIDFLQEIGVVERNCQYIVGEKSMSYRFSPEYFTNKMAVVKLKTKKAINFAKRSFLKAIAKAAKNKVERETLRAMAITNFLLAAQLLILGKKKAKLGYITKKGLILTYLGKNMKKNYKNFNKTRTSVEDGVELYKILFETNGIFLPVSSKNAGGRITTCFNLLPSWIREELKMDGIEKRVELDFACLHPNIANSIYGGTGAHINHDQVVDELYPSATPKEKAKKRNEVKIEHLSFFNKPLKRGMYDKRFIPGMEDSILFEYYMKKEPEMMMNIIKEKEMNGYRSTARALFEIETAIMTEVVDRVNKINDDIRMMYLYDAIEVDVKYKDVVRDVMNKVAKESGVNTFAK